MFHNDCSDVLYTFIYLKFRALFFSSLLQKKTLEFFFDGEIWSSDSAHIERFTLEGCGLRKCLADFVSAGLWLYAAGLPIVDQLRRTWRRARVAAPSSTSTRMYSVSRQGGRVLRCPRARELLGRELGSRGPTKFFSRIWLVSGI